MTQPFRSDQQRVVEDRYPDARTVRDFHRNADIDVGAQSIHHTLGPAVNQASPGSHSHDGNQSRKIDFSNIVITPPTVTGSRGGNAALQSLLNQLASMGLIVNNTTV